MKSLISNDYIIDEFVRILFHIKLKILININELSKQKLHITMIFIILNI